MRGLGRVVWLRAPRGSEATDRADRLARAVGEDLSGLVEGGSGSRPPTWKDTVRESRSVPWWAPRVALPLWTLVVVIGWVVASEAEYRSQTHEWLSFDRGFFYWIFSIVACALWVVGFLMIRIWRSRCRVSPRPRTFR